MAKENLERLRLESENLKKSLRPWIELERHSYQREELMKKRESGSNKVREIIRMN